jgi:lipopolysaccharide/colanic/teichoic acid biosynthesis glycosyltransferase
MSIEVNYAGLDHAHTNASGAYTENTIAFKRGFDLFLCIIAMPFVLLVVIPIALLVAIDGHNPFFTQIRVGRNGREFRCLKFRTMIVDAERKLAEVLQNDPAIRAEWDETHKLKNDPRITLIGRFLRKTSLDELPQVWNVLRGDMSLVGPRPVVPDELPRYGTAVTIYLACVPGVTGLWQVSGRSDVSYAARVALDVQYVERWSPLLDLKILLLTAPAALGRRGAY